MCGLFLIRLASSKDTKNPPQAGPVSCPVPASRVAAGAEFAGFLAGRAARPAGGEGGVCSALVSLSILGLSPPKRCESQDAGGFCVSRDPLRLSQNSVGSVPVMKTSL